MYDYINGKITYRDEARVVVECGGIGYEALVSRDAAANLRDGSEVKLYVYLHAREDGVSLFGFTSRDEKAMFLKLLGVNGVGPKLALSVLSGLPARGLAVAIANGDAAALSAVKGVGKKTAERIILELREKVEAVAVTEDGAYGGAASDAVLALTALGIPRAEAARRVGAVCAGGNKTLEEIVAAALKRGG